MSSAQRRRSLRRLSARARVRSIRSEAAFTPYYALTGDDASRLMYRAELVLQGEAARQLPAGLPLSAERGDARP